MANSIEDANRAASERVPAHSSDGTDGSNAAIDLITPTKSPKQGRRVLKDTTNTPQGSGSTNRDVVVSKLDPPGKRGARKPARDTHGSSSRRGSKPVKGTRRKQRGERNAASTGHASAGNNGHRIREASNDSSMFDKLVPMADQSSTRTNSPELKRQEKMNAANIARAPHDRSVSSDPVSMVDQSSTRTKCSTVQELLDRNRREMYAKNMGRTPQDVLSDLFPTVDQSATRTKRSKVQELLDRNRREMYERIRRERMDAANTERAPAEKTNSHANEAPNSSSMLSGIASNRAREPVECEREPRAALNTGNAPAENNSHLIREPTRSSGNDSVSSDRAVCNSPLVDLDAWAQPRSAFEEETFPRSEVERLKSEMEKLKSENKTLKMLDERATREWKKLTSQIESLHRENKELKTIIHEKNQRISKIESMYLEEIKRNGLIHNQTSSRLDP